MNLKSRPTPQEAERLIRRAIRNREVVLVVGSCAVSYKGRAASTLGEGERILIIKSDGACLLHRPYGYKPVNWQPAGTVIRTHAEDGALVIEGLRRTPREVLRIEFTALKTILSGSLEDSAQFAMYATERVMQRAIFLRPQLIEEGLKPLKIEKEHPRGYIDILAVDREGREVILEVKRNEATKRDALQMYKYVSEYRLTNPAARGVLVAPSLSKEAQLLLSQLNLEFKRLRLEECERVVAGADEE